MRRLLTQQQQPQQTQPSQTAPQVGVQPATKPPQQQPPSSSGWSLRSVAKSAWDFASNPENITNLASGNIAGLVTGGAAKNVVAHPVETAKAVGEMALQPARFVERAGKGIGELGLTEQQRKKTKDFMGPGLQEQALGKDKATPGYRSGKQALGGVLQTGANLATPFMAEAGTAGFALQGAAISGGKALEEDKSYTQAGVEAVEGAAIGGGLSVASNVAGRLMEQGGWSGVMDYFGRTGRGLSESEVGTIKSSPEVQATAKNYYERLTGAGKDLVKQQEAKQGIEGEIFDQARDAWNSYADKAGAQYDKDMALHAKNTVEGGMPLGKQELRTDLVDLGQRGGMEITVNQGKATVDGGTDAERSMVQKLFNKIKTASGGSGSVTGELGFDQLDTLRKDIGGLYDYAQPNTPEKAILDQYYNQVKKRMMSLSKDPEAVQATFDAYKEFLSNQSSFKKLASNKSDPAAVRSAYLELTRALTGQKGTGEMSSALEEALRAAGTDPKELAYKVQALSISSKLAGVEDTGTTKALGTEILKGATKPGGFSLGGLAEKAINAGVKTVADKAFMKSLFDEAGVEATPVALRTLSTALQKIGGIVSNPQGKAILINLIENLASGVQNPATKKAPAGRRLLRQPPT